jgi:Uma2 family endonuclease
MAISPVEVVVAPTPGMRAVDGASDLYRYGWRYVRRERDDGVVVMEQVPLTLEDVLHPQEGDQVTHSDAHQRRRRYLMNVLEAQFAADPTAVVLDDVRVAWDHPDLKPHGSDIMVILGVQARKNWSTFNVANEGVRPALIIEITSPETASIDRSNKLDEYDLAGVPLYVIVDMVMPRQEPGLRLLAYTQTPDGYQVLPPDRRGRIWLAPAQLWLGIEEHEIICYDVAERPLGNYLALRDALAAEMQAREVAEQRAATAEARVRELEAELERLRRLHP